MNKKLEEKDELDIKCKKLEGDIEKKNKELVGIKEEIDKALDELKGVKSEIEDMWKERESLEVEVDGYVKKKLELKDRKDKLDAQEKYLRKRFEEAGIKFD